MTDTLLKVGYFCDLLLAACVIWVTMFLLLAHYHEGRSSCAGISDARRKRYLLNARTYRQLASLQNPVTLTLVLVGSIIKLVISVVLMIFS